MNKYPQYIVSNLMIIVVSLFCVCFSVNAAILNMEEEQWQGDLNFNENFLYDNEKKLDQLQAQEELKNNYLLVIRLIKEKKLTEAKREVSLFIQDNPTELAYYDLKALLHILDKEPAAAEQTFKKMITLNNHSESANLGLAKLELDKKHFDQAQKYASKVLQINPHEIKAYNVLAEVTLQQEGIDAAENLLLATLVKVKGNVESEISILKLLGRVYLEKGQLEKLLQLANELAERNQGNSAALSYLMSVQLISQDLTGSEKNLRQLIAQQPGNAKYLFLLARVLSKQAGHESEVLELLDKAARGLNNPTEVLAFKSAFLIKQKKYQQAFDIAKQLDESYPANSIGKALKGDVYLAQKKYTEAFHNYQLAFQLTPNMQTLDVMLNVLAVQNKHMDAIQLLKNELEKSRDNARIKFKLAGAYQDIAQYELSIIYYEELLAIYGDNVTVLNNLAWAYSQVGNQKALGLAKKAYKKAPTSAVVTDTYGYILLKNGRKQDALKMLEQAVLLEPKMAEIQLHLAEAYIANQKKAQARKILKQLIDEDGLEKSAASKLMEKL